MKVLPFLQDAMNKLNNSKVFAGCMMILMNIGSKYITVKLSKSQEAYFRNNIARELLIFVVCWMGTRDLLIALMLTASFYILSQHLFHEESRLCILPKKYREFHMVLDTNQDGEISQQEISDAVNILSRAKMQQSTQIKENLYQHFDQYKTI
jgi:hypothetical protein